MRARQDPEFPSHNTFARFGGKAKLAARLIEFCQEHEGYEDVAAICAPISLDSEPETTSNATERLEAFGSVYLLKFGRHYKIGRTNSVGRRKRELAIQLPERATVVHPLRLTTLQESKPTGTSDLRTSAGMGNGSNCRRVRFRRSSEEGLCRRGG